MRVQLCNNSISIVRRHILGRVSGKQMMAAMEQLNYQNSDFFKYWVKRRYSGTITTTANEEFIGCAKNKKHTQGNRKFRQPAVSAQLSLFYLMF